MPTLLVNLYPACRPRPNPTPTITLPLTLTPTPWRARGRQGRSHGSAACFEGVFPRTIGRLKGGHQPSRHSALSHLFCAPIMQIGGLSNRDGIRFFGYLTKWGIPRVRLNKIRYPIFRGGARQRTPAKRLQFARSGASSPRAWCVGSTPNPFPVLRHPKAG